MALARPSEKLATLLRSFLVEAGLAREYRVRIIVFYGSTMSATSNIAEDAKSEKKDEPDAEDQSPDRLPVCADTGSDVRLVADRSAVERGEL